MQRSICAILLSGAALAGPLARGMSAQPRRPAGANGPVQYQDANATPVEQTRGFIRKIETGKPTTPLMRIGQYLFLGSDEPCFYTIDGASGQVVNRKGLAEPVFGFRRDGGRLLRVNGYPPEALVSFDRSIESEFDPNDAAAQLEKASSGRRVPFAWWQNISGDGQVAYRDGKYFRPCGGGQVRVLQGQEVTILTSRLKLTNWKMLLSPYGDYGYGAGGVYSLDENLCPASQLITTGPSSGVDAALVMQMGCDAKTLGILVRDVRHQTTFQVWTRDGQTQLREESLGRDYYVPDRGRVQAVDGGYLLSVNELIWVPAAPGGRTWRCDPLGAEGRRNESGPLHFGIPSIVCGKVFVTCADGIYVFDESKITGAAHVNAAPPTGPRPIEEGIVMKHKGADPGKKITVLTIP